MFVYMCVYVLIISDVRKYHSSYIIFSRPRRFDCNTSVCLQTQFAVSSHTSSVSIVYNIMSRLVCVYMDRYARRIIYNVIHNGIIYYTNGRLLVVPVQCAKIRDRRRPWWRRWSLLGRGEGVRKDRK